MTTVRTPALNRGQALIEQDLWIRWLAEHGSLPGGVDLPRERLIAGRWQEKEFAQLAEEEVERLGLIGRVGVVVLPPRATLPWRSDDYFPGVIRLRHDAYAATGRAEPEEEPPESPVAAIKRAAMGDEPFVRIAWQKGTFLRTGEVVLITSTSPRGVIANRIGTFPGRTLPVNQGERSWAMSMVGIDKPANFVPEAAALLREHVDGAIGRVAPPGKPIFFEDRVMYPPGDLEATDTEDGVLVTDRRYGKAGTKILLFTPLVSELAANAVQTAEARRKRTAAIRVVAIEFDIDPLRMDKPNVVRRPDLVITNERDISFDQELVDAMLEGPPR